jgi:DNA-directed RNA polymerase specialized sigma24 family protein
MKSRLHRARAMVRQYLDEKLSAVSGNGIQAGEEK